MNPENRHKHVELRHSCLWRQPLLYERPSQQQPLCHTQVNERKQHLSRWLRQASNGGPATIWSKPVPTCKRKSPSITCCLGGLWTAPWPWPPPSLNLPKTCWRDSKQKHLISKKTRNLSLGYRNSRRWTYSWPKICIRWPTRASANQRYTMTTTPGRQTGAIPEVHQADSIPADLILTLNTQLSLQQYY